MGKKWTRFPIPSILMKTLFLALMLAGASLVLAACGAMAPSADSTPTPPLAPTVEPTAVSTPVAATNTASAPIAAICQSATIPDYLREVVLAKDAQGADYTPVNVTNEFAPDQQTFHAVATLQNAPANTKLRAVWYLVSAQNFKSNSKIDENELTVAEGGSRNIDFTLKSAGTNWPSGSYCVEIYVNGALALSKTFAVVGGSASPPAASGNPVKQVVLAQDTQPQTFEPVNPTTTFKKDSPFIHAAVQIESAPTNTNLRARWYPPGQDPLNFDLTTDGSRWLDFRLTPAPDGFPTGDYKVEIYVGDKLVDTKTFTVQ